MVGYKIKIYRLLKGWSLDELAAEVHRRGGQISKVALSKFERGLINPTLKNLEILATVFGVKTLELVIPRKFEIKHLGFRKKQSLPKVEEHKYRNSAELELEKYFWLIERLSPLFPNRSSLKMQEVNTIEEAEAIAEDLRKQWELGEGPIGKLTTVMEKNNCFVLPRSGSEKFDAYSVIARDIMGDFHTGLVLYNEDFTGDRQRFTLSHELGHFLISNDDVRKNEQFANRFASAFLMPKSEIRSVIGFKRTHLTLEELIEYKKYFGASIHAIIYRLRDIGTINDDFAREWFMVLSACGMRKNEPGESLPKEEPEYIRTLLLRAIAEGFLTRVEAANKFGIEIKEKSDTSISKITEFLQLPKGEQKKILSEQAQQSIIFYAEDKELKEFREADLGVIDE
jgi:Zn-dependent peptidase ImmA (M78 family)